VTHGFVQSNNKVIACGRHSQTGPIDVGSGGKVIYLSWSFRRHPCIARLISLKIVLTTIEKQLHSGVVKSEPGVGEPLLETRIMVRAIGQFIVLMRTMIVSIRSNQRENGRK
jgi:hypothetical protein